MKIAQKQSGRKKLDPMDKKQPVTIFLTPTQINILGGIESVKDMLLFTCKQKINKSSKLYQ
jgi:hypothetical protein